MSKVELFRGSWNVCLDETGVEDALKLGRATKNQWYKIYHSDLSRTTRTAKCIEKYNPDAELISTTKLRPMHLGELESKEVTPERVKFMKDLCRKHPDRKFPGLSPKSGEPGESFNDFKKRVLNFVIKVESSIKSWEKVLLVSHYRNINLLRSWIDVGEPGDLSVNIDMFNRKGPQEPGSMYWLNPDHRKLFISDNADESKSGLWVARHGTTIANA
jgi:broad specificity phosphatase PhoE